MKKEITNTEWLDEETFVVDFAPFKVLFQRVNHVHVHVEYYKSENKWKMFYDVFDKDGAQISYDDFHFMPMVEAEIITMAEQKLHQSQSTTSWEEIVVADDYEKYDALLDSIKNYYSSNCNIIGSSDEVAYQVEEIVNARFMELLHELDKKFGV